MSELFLSVLNRSLTASYVILFIIIIRLLLKKAPKVVSYALWGVAAFRLIIPFSFESMFSLMPRNTNTVPIPHDIIYQQNPKINSGLDVIDSLVSESLPAPAIGASVNPLQIYVEIGAYFWILGIMILLIYSLVSGILLKRQLRSAELIEQNIFEAKNLKTPFVLGLLRPKIYLPVGFNDKERSYILLHEQTHINRKDHIIKVLAFLVLSVHWFNPFVWIAFMLMSMDMELSCDERVLKEMNEDIKKPYANSLLSLATGRHILNGSPLAFGEGNVKGRIKNVLNYRKPPFWIIVFALAIAAVVSIGLLTNPKKQEPIFNEEGSGLLTNPKEQKPIFNEENSVSYEFIQLVNGEVQYTVSPLSGDNAQLAEDIIMNYMIKSAAWPGMDISTLGECYLLRATYSDGTTSDYYMFLHDGRAVMQWGIDGHYSFIENELYKKILEAVSSGKTAVVGIDDEDKYADDIDLLPGFTDEEVTSARAVVEEYFRSIQEKDREAILKTLTPIYNQPNVVFGDGIRTLLSIDYNEDDPMRKSYVEHGRGSINGTQKEDVIVFRVSFNVKYPKGASGSFNEGDYTNWSMILIREGKESPWLIDDQGY